MQNNWKKRIFTPLALSFLLIGMLLHSGKAEEMQSIHQLKRHAPERWEQTYHAHGREIPVDVQPFIPDIIEFPIIKAVFDFNVPDVSKLDKGWQSLVRDDGVFRIYFGEHSPVKKSAKAYTTTSEYFPPFDLDKTYAQHGSLTLRESMSHLQLIMQATNHGEWFLNEPTRLSVNLTTKGKEGEVLGSETFHFSFVPAFKGIPIICHAINGIDSPKDASIGVFPFLHFGIGTPGIMDISGIKLTTTEILAEDVPLKVFSAIQECIEEEIRAGHIRKVFDLQLGYVLYNEPGSSRKPGYDWMKTAQFYALPAWVVSCHYIDNPTKDMRDYSGRDVPERSVIEYKTLLINAQTGIVMNREDNRIEAADYTGFISWEDIGGRP